MVLKELKNFACKKLSAPVLKIYSSKNSIIEEGNNPSNNLSKIIQSSYNSFNSQSNLILI